jgi:4-diphosphocytidyl-2-C-methyl-D-erythritol kinase
MSGNEKTKMKCTVKAPAKINLSLDVTGKREDGYHLLETVMQTIDLCDIITVDVEEKGSEDIRITLASSGSSIPLDARNTAYKACAGYFEELAGKTTSTGFDIHITIEKHIPMQAGLAGGSADAAGVLKALDYLFNGVIDFVKLMNIAVSVGADVPFCLSGGTCLCEGIGEIISPLKGLLITPVLIIKPPFGVSTPWIFKQLEIADIQKRPDTPAVIRSIESRDFDELFSRTANVLEEVTAREYPIIKEIVTTMLGYGAAGSMMSGSGSSVFAVFKNENDAKKAYTEIKNNPKWSGYVIISTETTQNGPVVTASDTKINA